MEMIDRQTNQNGRGAGGRSLLNERKKYKITEETNLIFCQIKTIDKDKNKLKKYYEMG